MNINFGLFPPVETPRTDDSGQRIKGKAKSVARKKVMSARALQAIDAWLAPARAAAE